MLDGKSIALDEPYLANLFANELIHLPACLPLEQQSKELPFHPDRALLPDVVIIQPPIRIDPEALSLAYGKISMALHAHIELIVHLLLLLSRPPNGFRRLTGMALAQVHIANKPNEGENTERCNSKYERNEKEQKAQQ